MKQKIVGPIMALMLLSGMWGIIYTHSIFSPSIASAREAKLIPLAVQPIAGNDNYGVYRDKTLNVSAPGLLSNDLNVITPTLEVVHKPANGVASINNNGSFSYRPNNNFSGTDSFTYRVSNSPTEFDEALVTIGVRSIFFREDRDNITKGECVTFTWLVRGDVDLIEFEIFDDNKSPFLVDKPSGERQECPIRDRTYQLIVRWLDGTSDKESKIEIEVDESAGTGDGGGGGGGGGQIVVEGTIAPVGPFFLVTPILITNVPGIALVATPVPDAASLAAPKPTGVLESVSTLPETGALPSVSETPVSNPLMLQPKGNSSSVQSHHDRFWLTTSSRMGILLGTIVISLTLLVKFCRQSA